MFLLATVGTVTQLDVQSLSYIDTRQFPGAGGVFVPGPLGYQELIATNAIVVIENLVFVLSDWLADGFLVSSFNAVFAYPGGSPTPLVLSLLCCLLYEPLGHYLPLPSVPWLVWYISEFSANLRQYSGLTL